MNLLFVCDGFPYPPRDASAIIAYHWMRCLAPGHRLGLVSQRPPAEPTARSHLEALGIAISEHAPETVRGLGLTRGLFGRRPSAFGRIAHEAFRRHAVAQAQAHQADVAILVGPALGTLLVDGSWPLPVVFVPYDSVALNLTTRLPFVQHPLRRAWWWLEQQKWSRVEREVYPTADACVVLTDRDAEALTRQWSSDARPRLWVLPYGIDTEYYAPQAVPERPHHLVFTGNMAGIQSVVSIEWFMTKVLPRVQAAVPDATLDIVGRDPPPHLERAARRLRGVRVTGYVDDVRPHVLAASIYVCPLILGSGVKTRLLETMALGKAIVAMPLAAYGLRAQPGEDIIIARDASDMAEKIVALLHDDSRRQQLGRRARQAVMSCHSWTAVTTELERLVQAVAGARSVAPEISRVRLGD
jgi:glycosyltransferase involved in cell wall biosynthesis